MALSSPLLEKINDSNEEFILPEKFNRYKKFEEYVKIKNFDNLMLRLAFEHSDEYINSCYNRGYRPTPNNKLQFILDYLNDNYADIVVKKISTKETNKTWSYNGYYFQVIDDSMVNVINKDDLTLIIKL